VLIAWLLTLAHAGCPPLQIDGSLPTPGATDVPTDQPVLLLVPDGPCAGELGLGLVDASGSSRSIPFERDRLGATWVYRSIDLPLSPGETYSLAVHDGRAPFLIPFTTGSRPYEAPLLSLSLHSSELESADDGFTATVRVSATGAPGTLLHWTGAAEPTDPWFATLATGGEVEQLVPAQVIDDEACVAVRAETPQRDMTPWIQTCVEVPPVDPIPQTTDTGEPPKTEDTGFPIDTGYYWENYYYDHYYSGSDDFILFGCGGCQSTGTPPAWLFPMVLVPWMRRRR